MFKVQTLPRFAQVYPLNIGVIKRLGLVRSILLVATDLILLEYFFQWILFNELGVHKDLREIKFVRMMDVGVKLLTLGYRILMNFHKSVLFRVSFQI